MITPLGPAHVRISVTETSEDARQRTRQLQRLLQASDMAVTRPLHDRYTTVTVTNSVLTVC